MWVVSRLPPGSLSLFLENLRDAELALPFPFFSSSSSPLLLLLFLRAGLDDGRQPILLQCVVGGQLVVHARPRHGACEWPYGENVRNGEITTWGWSTLGRGIGTNSPLPALLLALPLVARCSLSLQGTGNREQETGMLVDTSSKGTSGC